MSPTSAVKSNLPFTLTFRLNELFVKSDRIETPTHSFQINVIIQTIVK